jgi:hypothetical protein
MLIELSEEDHDRLTRHHWTYQARTEIGHSGVVVQLIEWCALPRALGERLLQILSSGLHFRPRHRVGRSGPAELRRAA